MATYKDDLDILKAAEKADTNKLTFNAITELDNKGLLGRYGGEGGGDSGDSLVKAADVRFVTDDPIYSRELSNVFPEVGVCRYRPGDGIYPAYVSSNILHETITEWNDLIDDGMRLIAPQGIWLTSDSYNVSVVSGSAEIIEVEDEGPVLYITGDCTIQISVTTSDYIPDDGTLR